MRILISMAILSILVCANAEARRHKKFKGVIIVNQILKLDGHITKNGEDVPEYSGVKQGDVLETPDKSSAVIRIPGLAIFRMGANTKFKLTQFNDRNEARFDLLNGELLALFRRVGTHEIKLPRSTVKLHGTTFIISINKDTKIESYRLDEGKLEIAFRGTPVSAPTPVKTTPTPEPTPVASPLFHASLSAPTPMATVAGKVASTPIPTPIPTPGLPTEVTLTATTDAQFCEIRDDGINVKPDHKLDDVQAEIKDLESLYALP